MPFPRGQLVASDPHAPRPAPGPLPAALSLNRGIDSARGQAQLYGGRRGPTAPVDDSPQLRAAAGKINPARGRTPIPSGPIGAIFGGTDDSSSSAAAAIAPALATLEQLPATLVTKAKTFLSRITR